MAYCQRSWRSCRLIPPLLSDLIGSRVQSWKQDDSVYMHTCVCAHVRSLGSYTFTSLPFVDRSYNDHFWRRVARQPALLGIVIGDKFSVERLTDIGVLLVSSRAYKLWPLYAYSGRASSDKLFSRRNARNISVASSLQPSHFYGSTKSKNFYLCQRPSCD